MGSFLELRGIDLGRVKAALGSGDAAFAETVVKTIPDDAEGRGLEKDGTEAREWTRGVQALVLGELGGIMSAREALSDADPVKSGSALSLAYVSVLRGLSQGPEASLQVGGSGVELLFDKLLKKYVGKLGGKGLALEKRLFSRPVFGLESDCEDALWGALGRTDVAALAERLPAPEDAPDAKDEDVEALYGDLHAILQAVRADGLDLVSFYA